MFIELRILEQHNSKDVLYKGSAPLDDSKRVQTLFLTAKDKGLMFDVAPNEKFLSDKKV